MTTPVQTQPITLTFSSGGGVTDVDLAAAIQVVATRFTPDPPPPPPPPTPVALGICATDVETSPGVWRRDSWPSVQGQLTGTVPAVTMKFLPLILTQPQGGKWGALAGDTLGWLNDSIATGSTPIITWEWRDFSLDPAGPQPAFSNAAVLAGQWDAMANAWLATLRAWLAADPRNRVILRLDHEGQGIWYPWAAGPGNKNGNKAYTAIGAFRRKVSMIRAALGPDLAPRAPILWTPGTRGGGWDALENHYPGSLSVDYLGFDLYNFEAAQGGWLDFVEAAKPFYDRVCRLDPDKPIIVAETGCGESAAHDKAAWFANLTRVPAAMPRIRAIVEFDRMYAGGTPNYSVSLSPNPAVYQAWKDLAADPLMQGRI